MPGSHLGDSLLQNVSQVEDTVGTIHEGVEEDICQSRQEDSSVTLELTWTSQDTDDFDIGHKKKSHTQD